MLALQLFGRQVLGQATLADAVVFFAASAVVIAGAMGVVFSSNPVHSALMLVMTLFGVAVLFVSQQAHFLAVVQVIVYAGAIVVLFLFVIMLLGVDREEAIDAEELSGQRPAAYALVVLAVAELLLLVFTSGWDVGTPVDGAITAVDPAKQNVAQLAEVIFTRYLFAFEATSVLLVIAVVGAVVLARRPEAVGDRRSGAAEREDATP